MRRTSNICLPELHERSNSCSNSFCPAGQRRSQSQRISKLTPSGDFVLPEFLVKTVHRNFIGTVPLTLKGGVYGRTPGVPTCNHCTIAQMGVNMEATEVVGRFLVRVFMHVDATTKRRHHEEEFEGAWFGGALSRSQSAPSKARVLPGSFGGPIYEATVEQAP